MTKSDRCEGFLELSCSLAVFLFLLMSVIGCENDNRYELGAATCDGVYNIRDLEERDAGHHHLELTDGRVIKLEAAEAPDFNRYFLVLSDGNEMKRFFLCGSSGVIRMSMKILGDHPELIIEGELYGVKHGTRLLLTDRESGRLEFAYEGDTSRDKTIGQEMRFLFDVENESLTTLSRPVLGWRNTLTGKKIDIHREDCKTQDGTADCLIRITEEDAAGDVLRELTITSRSVFSPVIHLLDNGRLAVTAGVRNYVELNGDSIVSRSSASIGDLLSVMIGQDGTVGWWAFLEHASVSSDGSCAARVTDAPGQEITCSSQV